MLNISKTALELVGVKEEDFELIESLINNERADAIVEYLKSKNSSSDVVDVTKIDIAMDREIL